MGIDMTLYHVSHILFAVFENVLNLTFAVSRQFCR